MYWAQRDRNEVTTILQELRIWYLVCYWFQCGVGGRLWRRKCQLHWVWKVPCETRATEKDRDWPLGGRSEGIGYLDL